MFDDSPIVRSAVAWLAEAPKEKLVPFQCLDLATGAGSMTTTFARAFRQRGHVTSIDIDPESWTEFAEPKLRELDLTEAVTFRQMDLCDCAELLPNKYHGISCHLTLSTMGIHANTAVRQWRKILHPGGRVIIYDYLPQKIPNSADEELIVEAWRLYKAASVLEGIPHYEEYPPEFWERQLAEEGFVVHPPEVDDILQPRSQESLDEWLDIPFEPDITNQDLKQVLMAAHQRLKDHVAKSGFMLRWSGVFALRAELP